MQGQEKAILDDNETEDHDPTTNVIGLNLSLLIEDVVCLNCLYHTLAR